MTVLPKMAKNELSVFHNFTVLGFLTSKMTFKLKFDLIRPTFWGCPFFSFYDLFCQGAPNALKFHSKYIFRSFCAFDHLSLGFFIFSQIFLLSAFISILQVFEQSPFLFSFHFLSWPCSDASLPSLSAPLTNFLLLSGNGGIFFCTDGTGY